MILPTSSRSCWHELSERYDDCSVACPTKQGFVQRPAGSPSCSQKLKMLVIVSLSLASSRRHISYSRDKPFPCHHDRTRESDHWPSAEMPLVLMNTRVACSPSDSPPDIIIYLQLRLVSKLSNVIIFATSAISLPLRYSDRSGRGCHRI